MKRLALSFLLTAFAGRLWSFALGADEEWLSYRQVERGTPQPIAGIPNADFEDSTKFSRPVTEGAAWSAASKAKAGDVEYGRFGYNGNGGCRLHFHGAFRVFDFAAVKLKKDRTYTFSGMWRGSGKGSGVFAWAMFINGRYKTERGGLIIEKLNDGWVRGAVTFTPQFDGEGVVNKLHFQGNGPEGSYVDFDNLQIVEAVPTWSFSNTWPIHNAVYSEEGRVRCHNSFVGSFFETNAQPFYVMSLVAPDGKTLAEKPCRDEKGVVTCAFGRLAYEGPAKLVAALYDRRNRLGYGTRSVDVTVGPTFKPKPGRVFITEEGRTLVDGKPFMPLGFWTCFANFERNPRETLPGNLKKLADAGFNSIIEYNGYLLRDLKDRQYFYDQCRQYGIRVFAGECAIANWNDGDPEMPAKYTKIVRQYLDYPAIFAWFVTDEVSADRVPELVKMRKILNAEAPGVPMWPCNIFDPEPFLPGEDVAGGDFYPYRGPDSDLRTQDRRLARIEACRPAAAWIAPQCYNWGNQKRKRDGTWGISVEDYLKGEPDENQMLANALHMASRGVTGFLFYSYFDMLKTPDPALPAVRWERMKSIAKELKSLKPFITSGIRRVEVPHVERGDPTRVVALSDGQDHSRLLVIGLGLKHDCEIDLAQVKGLAGKSRYGKTTLKDGKAVFLGTGISCDILE